MAALAELEIATPAGAERAVTLMREVVKASPGREDFRLQLAQALLVQGDYSAATAYLDPLVGRARTPEIREAARRMLARVAQQGDAARFLDAGGSPDLVRRAPGPTAAERPASSSRDTALPGAFVPALRAVQPGESRVLGVFSGVDCRPGAIVLQVDTPDGEVRLAVARFEDVDLLSYRQDSPRSVACGPQRPTYRVLATFRTDATPIAGAGTNNQAVAIELLPDGYVPRP